MPSIIMDVRVYHLDMENTIKQKDMTGIQITAKLPSTAFSITINHMKPSLKKSQKFLLQEAGNTNW